MAPPHTQSPFKTAYQSKLDDTGAIKATEATGVEDREQPGLLESVDIDSEGGEDQGFDTGNDSEDRGSDVDAEGEVDMGVIYE